MRHDAVARQGPQRVAAAAALVANWPGIGRPLLQLSFIHFARWTLITSLPAPDGSGDEYPLNWPYLLFQASYDGDEDEYLNTFTDVIPWRLIKLFGTCFGFPRARARRPRGRWTADGAVGLPAASSTTTSCRSSTSVPTPRGP